VHNCLQMAFNPLKHRLHIDRSEKSLIYPGFLRYKRAPLISALCAIPTPDPQPVRLSGQQNAPAPLFTQHLLNRLTASL
jgi:hypothetical protein